MDICYRSLFLMTLYMYIHEHRNSEKVHTYYRLNLLSSTFVILRLLRTILKFYFRNIAFDKNRNIT